MFIDLKQGNLEQVLLNEGIGEEEVNIIRKDAQYYDKYFILKDEDKIGFIKIWRQHIKDPYIDVEVEECDLAGFKGQHISANKYIEVLDDIFEVPQVIRCEEKDCEIFKNKGFKDMHDKAQKKHNHNLSSSTLVNVIKEISDEKINGIQNFNNIRQMKTQDLPIIEDIFSKEYSLKFRAIKLMYDYDPESCFVYDDGVIKGVIFSQEFKDELYIHQIFIKEQFRKTYLINTLLKYVLFHATNLKKSKIVGTVRGNLIEHYRKFGMDIDRSNQKSYYLIRTGL